MNDHHPVDGQVHIELQTVRAGGHADVERRDGVLGSKLAAATMGEHLRLVVEKSTRGVGRRTHGFRKNN